MLEAQRASVSPTRPSRDVTDRKQVVSAEDAQGVIDRNAALGWDCARQPVDRRSRPDSDEHRVRFQRVTVVEMHPEANIPIDRLDSGLRSELNTTSGVRGSNVGAKHGSERPQHHGRLGLAHRGRLIHRIGDCGDLTPDESPTDHDKALAAGQVVSKLERVGHSPQSVPPSVWSPMD
jgi:hypothetical protein